MLTKRFFIDTLTIVAFPLQLISCAYPNYRNGSYGLLFILAIVAHFVYFKRVIKERMNEYREHFFYYEIGAAIVQAFLVTTNPVSIHTAPFWMMTVPLVVQVILCITMYLYGHPFDYIVIDEKHENVFKQDFYPFPTVHRKDLI
ncbi:hypothetical protein PRIPAC_84869 [Pristionchus pacificus]|nr:hypothetical protein PRIPAC_84869 [Pristionchus pacificus]